MMLIVSVTVNHLYQNLKNIKSVLIIAINAQSHSVDAPSPPPPWFGGGDHLCPYGRKLIGSLPDRLCFKNIYIDLIASLA